MPTALRPVHHISESLRTCVRTTPGQRSPAVRRGARICNVTGRSCEVSQTFIFIDCRSSSAAYREPLCMSGFRTNTDGCRVSPTV